jgi:hypothetical protein
MRVKDPFIYKVWEISTAHITIQDEKLLQGDCTSFSCTVFDFGFSIPVIDDNIDVAKKNFSPEFAHLMEIAEELNVQYLVLDADGKQHSELPLFDW